jgi:hypothetical protein
MAGSPPNRSYCCATRTLQDLIRHRECTCVHSCFQGVCAALSLANPLTRRVGPVCGTICSSGLVLAVIREIPGDCRAWFGIGTVRFRPSLCFTALKIDRGLSHADYPTGRRIDNSLAVLSVTAPRTRIPKILPSPPRSDPPCSPNFCPRPRLRALWQRRLSCLSQRPNAAGSSHPCSTH